MAEEMVKVRITATQKVRYDQIREMPRSEITKYQEMMERDCGGMEFDSDFRDYVDEGGDQEGDGVVDVEIEVLK